MKPRLIVSLFGLGATLFVGAGCQRDDMWEQARVNDYGSSEFFDDGRAARLPVEGTVARGAQAFDEDPLLHTGIENGAPATRFPYPITMKILERGRQRYDIFCSPCHAKTGEGDGMIVQRGFRQPERFSNERLKAASPGFFFNILRNGMGAKDEGVRTGTEDPEDKVHVAIGKKIKADDKWSIIAYIRVLQISQSANASDMTPEQMGKINAVKEEAPAGGGH